jgi:hypothetical protein
VSGSEARPAGWQRKVVEEVIEYAFDFVYLAFFLMAFAWYRRLILAEYDITYLGYGVPLVEAAVLAKIIMLGDLVPMGHGLQRRPLIVPTLLRSVLFSGYVAIFTLVERTLTGLLHGKGWAAGLLETESKGRYELLAQCVIIFAAFVPFFAFKELEKVLGKDELRGLFWRNSRSIPVDDAEANRTTWPGEEHGSGEAVTR